MVRNVLCGFRQFSFANVSATDQQMVANNSELENNVYSAIIWLGLLYPSIVSHTLSVKRGLPPQGTSGENQERLQNKDPAEKEERRGHKDPAA